MSTKNKYGFRLPSKKRDEIFKVIRAHPKSSNAMLCDITGTHPITMAKYVWALRDEISPTIIDVRGGVRKRKHCSKGVKDLEQYNASLKPVPAPEKVSAKPKVRKQTKDAADRADEFDWTNQGSKRWSDDSQLEILKKSFKNKSRLKLLTLPGDTFCMEEPIIKVFSDKQVHMVVAENNESVYQRLIKNADRIESQYPNTRISTSFGCTDAYNGITNTFRRRLKDGDPDQFSFVSYDWWGTISKDKIRDLKLTFERNLIEPDGFLGFTYCLNRGQSATWKAIEQNFTNRLPDGGNLIDVRPDSALRDTRYYGRTAGLAVVVKKWAKDAGVSLQCIECFVYYGNGALVGRPTPQARMLFQVKAPRARLKLAA